MPTRANHGYRFGAFWLDATDRLLYRDGALITLPPKVIDTLLLLVANNGRVLGKDEMMKHLWPDTFVEEGTLAQYVFLLRKALGDSASWIENHPRRGYRFTAPVEESENGNGELRIEDPAGTSADKGTNRFRFVAAGVAALVILTAAAFIMNYRRESDRGSFDSIAVLPFRTVSDSEGDYIADGITDALITKLASLKGLRVVSYSRVRQFKGSSLDGAGVGRKLGVQAVIEGTVRISSGQIRVSVHAVDTRSANTLWAHNGFEAGTDRLLDIEKQLAEAVTVQLRGRLTENERSLIAKSHTRNAEAYDHVLKARGVLRQGTTARNLAAATAMFERAVQLDPAYADAMGWLALAQDRAYHRGLGGPQLLRAAITNANQALSKDPNSMIAMRALAHIHYSTGRFVEGLLMSRRALATHPDDLDATAAAAEAYFRTGLSDRAVPLYHKALDGEPDNEALRNQLARIYYYLGEYKKGLAVISTSRQPGIFGLLLDVETGKVDKAVDVLRRSPTEDPLIGLGFTAYVKGGVLAAAGDLAGARNIWTQAVRVAEASLEEAETPWARYALCLSHAKLGHHEQALQHLRQMLAQDPRHPTFLFLAAEIHALVGNRREALDSLKVAVENGFLNLPLIDGMARSRICTLYSLRNDPEFLAIRADLAGRVDELRRHY